MELTYEDICEIEGFEEFTDWVGAIVRQNDEDIALKEILIETLEEMGKLKNLSKDEKEELFDAGLWYTPTVGIIEKIDITSAEVLQWILQNIRDIMLSYAGLDPERLYLGLSQNELTEDLVERLGCKEYTVEDLVVYDVRGNADLESLKNSKVYYIDYEEEDIDFVFEPESKPLPPYLRIVK
jgi:hypothetical protein